MDVPEGFRAEFEAVQTVDDQLDVIRKYFDIRQVQTDDDIRPHALYFLRGKQRTYLVRASEGEPGGEMVPMTLALSGRRIRPLPRQRLLKLAARGRLIRLVSRGHEGFGSELIDKRAFAQLLTQLISAAQQSGIVPDVDSIVQVKERDFRAGDYQNAFQTIERLYVKFGAAATRRQQRLRREDIDVRSGKAKISPRKLQQKRRRDAEQTVKIERARRSFARVLGGLRLLMISGESDTNPDS